MKTTDFNDLVASIESATAFLKGETVPGLRVHIPNEIDAKRIREQAGLSQTAFARRIGVSVGTLRNWEQGRRVPDGPAQVLLRLLDKNPNIVEDTLGTAA